MPTRFPAREFYPWATPLEYTVIGLSWGAIAVVFLPILWLGLGRSLREQTPAGAEWSNRRRTLRQLVENAFVWLLAIIPSFILPLVLTGDTTKTCPPILSHRLQWCAIATSLTLVGLCLFGAVAAGVRRIKGPTYGCLPVGIVYLLACLFVTTGVVISRSSTWTVISVSVCRSNLKQLAVAIHDHEEEVFHGERLGAVDTSWRVRLLPFIEQRELHARYDSSKPWDDPHNRPVATTRIPLYTCPATERHVDFARYPFPVTCYVTLDGPNSALAPGRTWHLGSIPDGASNTILLAEACGLEIPWAEPRDFALGSDPVGINLVGRSRTHSPSLLSSHHPGFCYALMADGSVRLIGENIDLKVLQALSTANGAESVPESGF